MRGGKPLFEMRASDGSIRLCTLRGKGKNHQTLSVPRPGNQAKSIRSRKKECRPPDCMEGKSSLIPSADYSRRNRPLNVDYTWSVQVLVITGVGRIDKLSGKSMYVKLLKEYRTKTREEKRGNWKKGLSPSEMISERDTTIGMNNKTFQKDRERRRGRFDRHKVALGIRKIKSNARLFRFGVLIDTGVEKISKMGDKRSWKKP